MSSALDRYSAAMAAPIASGGELGCSDILSSLPVDSGNSTVAKQAEPAAPGPGSASACVAEGSP